MKSIKLGAYVRYIVGLAGICGMILGFLIGAWNSDNAGWCFIRVATLGVVFAWFAHKLIKFMVLSWLENQIVEKELEIEKMKTEREQKRKAEEVKTPPTPQIK